MVARLVERSNPEAGGEVPEGPLEWGSEQQ